MNAENITAPTKTFSPPYTVLALVYDGMMSHVKYRRWAKYIHAILRRENFRGAALLDIGCGTGEFLNQMSRFNYELSGCDASIDMLNVARKKLPGLPLHIAELPLLQQLPENQYDISVCLYDTINYMLHESDLVKSFQSIYQKLRTPGIFIFDVVTKSYCEQFFQNYSEKEVIENGVAYSRESRFDAQHSIQTNYIQIFTADGVFEEIHSQKIYELQFILKVLKEETAFNQISVLADFSFKKADENSGRAHFIAKKQ